MRSSRPIGRGCPAGRPPASSDARHDFATEHTGKFCRSAASFGGRSGQRTERTAGRPRRGLPAGLLTADSARPPRPGRRSVSSLRVGGPFVGHASPIGVDRAFTGWTSAGRCRRRVGSAPRADDGRDGLSGSRGVRGRSAARLLVRNVAGPRADPTRGSRKRAGRSLGCYSGAHPTRTSPRLSRPTHTGHSPRDQLERSCSQPRHVQRVAVMTISTRWNSLRSLYPVVAIARRKAPTRFIVPSATCDGPCMICASGPTVPM